MGFYSDLAAVHVEGLTAPWPHLGAFLRVSPPAWECYCARGDFLGANSCPQSSSHSLWERICLPLVPCAWLPWAWPSSWVVSVPKASLGRQGYFTSQVALDWCYHYGLEATFLFSLSLPRIYRDLRPSHGVAPSMVFPTHGYRGATLWLPYSCDILPWRRPTSATPTRRRLILATLPLGNVRLGDACTWRCLA